MVEGLTVTCKVLFPTGGTQCRYISKRRGMILLHGALLKLVPIASWCRLLLFLAFSQTAVAACTHPCLIRGNGKATLAA